MKARYIVMVDDSSKTNRDFFINRLLEKGHGYASLDRARKDAKDFTRVMKFYPYKVFKV